MDAPCDKTRREFLKTAGIVAVGAGFWPGSFLRTLAAAEDHVPSVDAKVTLDALLSKNQEHDRRAGAGGPNNHVPMTLVALYRMGASPQAMNRYVASFDELFNTPPNPKENPKADGITVENWRSQVGRATFFQYLSFFEGWMKQAPVDAVLRASVPTLLKSSISQFYHSLLRLGYAVDYGNHGEIAFSLAHWASSYYPSPDFDSKGPPVEPDALLSEIVKNASAFQVELKSRAQAEVLEMYASSGFSRLLKPVRVPDSDPLGKISELLMENFTRTQHFDLLHLLTSCQALRLVLPYSDDLRKSLSEYWHSACATYVSVSRHFDVGRASVAGGGPGWEEIHAETVDNGNKLGATREQHDIKLVYSCWSEFQHYKRDRYLALASRELGKSSPSDWR